MQVLLFEPNKTIASAFIKRLEAAGAKCVSIDKDFFDADAVKAVASSITTAALLISDDGAAEGYIKTLRANGCKSPIISILGQKDSSRARELIDSGADDALVVPINGEEVLARAKAIIRRSYGHVSASVTIGDVKAYFDGRDPEANGQRIRLSGREHAIFTHLALQPGRVISKEQIYAAVYGLLDSQPYAKVIDVYICKIRKKLEESTGNKYIETVYGRGYKLTDPYKEKEARKRRPEARPNGAHVEPLTSAA